MKTNRTDRARRRVYVLLLVALVISTAGCTPAPTPVPPTVTALPVTVVPAPSTSIPPASSDLPTLTAAVSLVNAIAFSSSTPAGIQVIQIDGRIDAPISHTSSAAMAAWSPDGKRITYIVHYGDSNWSIYLVGSDGENPQRLTQGNLDYSLSWSPDGTQIAFSRNGNLWVMRVSSGPQPAVSDLRQLTSDPQECIWATAWSPDGQEIAFDAQRGDPTGTASYNDPQTSEIYLINADGSNPRKLTDNHVIDAGPGWSPDGKQIVFFSNRDGDPNYTMKMAFTSRSEGSFQIYSMTADGEHVQRLTNTTANDFQPAWSPDGKQIAFSSNRDGNYEIYVMNAGGSEPRRLTDSSSQDYQPAWLP